MLICWKIYFSEILYKLRWRPDLRFASLCFVGFCIYNGIPYQEGKTFEDGCDKICTCENGMLGHVTCKDRSVSYVFTYESWIKILLCHLSCLWFLFPWILLQIYNKLDLKTWPAFLWVFIFSVVISWVKSINLDLPIENECIKNAAI